MQPSDLLEYMHACKSGVFYKTLARTLHKPFVSGSQQREVKVTAMRLIFGPCRPQRRSWRRFSERWPSVASHLIELKRDGHRNVSHVLQRAESSLMIGGVCAELMERYPAMPVASIHDSLLIPPASVDAVSEVVCRVWEEQAGVRPKLRAK